MNMRMGKLLNTLGPLPVPVVHTATATLPPTTEVKLSAPLSLFASASASKPKDANQYLWEMIGQDNVLPPFDVYDPDTEITGQRSPTLPPTSIAASEKGGRAGGDPPGDDPNDDNAPKGSDKPKVVAGPLMGADDHREVGQGMEMMMEMTTVMKLMTVTVSSPVG